MIDLNSFFFTPSSVLYLTQVLLVVSAVVYFLRMYRQTHNVGIVSLVFAGLTGVTILELMRSAAVWERQFLAIQWRYVFLGVMIFATLQVVYRFPLADNDPFTHAKKRELPLLSLIYGTLTLAALAFTLYQNSQLRLGGHPLSIESNLDFVVVILVLIILAVLLRRSWSLFRQSSSRSSGQETLRTVRNMIAAAFCFSLTTILVAASRANLLPVAWVEFITTLINLIVIALVLMALLNVTQRRDSLIVRLVTPVLLTVFVGMGLVSQFVAQRVPPPLESRPERIAAQTLHFQPSKQGDTVYSVASQPLQLDNNIGSEIQAAAYTLPFDFPLADGSYRTVTLDPAGTLAFGDWNETLFEYNYLPAIGLRQNAGEPALRIYGHANDTQAVFSWLSSETTNSDTAPIVFQITLNAGGDFTLAYPELPGASFRRIGYQTGNGGADFAPFNPRSVQSAAALPTGDGLLIDFDIMKQQAGHPGMLPLVYMILTFSLVSIVGFPVLFYRVLVRPLNDLVAGVQAVEAGNLDIQVQIHSSDEIGKVSQAFNQMVNAVLEVEQNLAEKVDHRSRELAESERRLGALQERERIGRELHDNLGQVIGYITMRSEAALQEMEKTGQGGARQILQEINHAARQVNQDVRQAIQDIRGADAAAPGFWSALENYLALVRSRYGLEVTLQTDAAVGSTLQLDPEVEIQVLRILQEGLSNAARHAGAGMAALHFAMDENWLTVDLRDNGRGFAADAVPEGHYGLKIMHERAEAVNGQMTVNTVPGAGTHIQLRVPVKRRAAASPTESHYAWRVLVVDDHSLFLEGLTNLLRPHGIQIVGTAQNGVEAQQLAAELQPELILMDIHMPELDGLEAARHIKQHFPQIKIVMLTVAAEEKLLLQAIQYGASGYLLKDLPAPQFLSLLADVMAGKTIIAPDLANLALTTLARFEAGKAPGRPVLTERQQEVLRCISLGMSNRQIAEKLFISERTVKYHVSQIMDRLGLQTRYELIRHQLDQDS